MKRRLLFSAFAVCIFILVCILSFHFGKKHVIGQVPEVFMKVPYASRMSLVLPDSTAVWLNSGSSLAYKQSFGISERSVQLSGEACFHVAHDDENPFIVHCGRLTAQTTGTDFNIKNVPGDLQSSIVLTEGGLHIWVEGNPTMFILKPGQKFIYQNDTGKAGLYWTGAASKYSGWMEGYLYCDEIPLCDIIRDLERRYDVRIVINSPSLAGRKFYCGFNTSDLDIDDVLSLLCETNKLHFDKEADHFTLYE